MAGNIIAAIATTNAITAGSIVMQALAFLKGDYSSARTTTLKAYPVTPLGWWRLEAPSPNCAVCQDAYIPLRVDASKCTLGEFIEGATEWLGPSLAGELEASVMEGGRILADPDFDDNHGKTLAELKIGRGMTITLTDEDDKYRPIHFCLLLPDPNATGNYTLPDHPPTLPLKPVPVAAASDSEPEIVEPSPSKKRPADDSDDQPAKKRKVNGSQNGTIEINDDDEDFSIID